MKKYRVKVGIDVDDVLYECNSYAIKLLNDENPELEPVNINDIRTWGASTGTRVDERRRFFSDPEFVRTQPVIKGAKKFIRKLTKIAEVFFVTAVPAECMSARASRLINDFPEVPTYNTIIATRKDVVNLDIMLDDGGHNIVSSQAAYPVLFRRPWNGQLSGLLAVNDYDDFLHIVEQVANSFMQEEANLNEGGIACLIGPSGSGKTAIMEQMIKENKYVKPITTTTRERRPGESVNAYRFISEKEFVSRKDNGNFLETTVYSGHFYGTSVDEIDSIIKSGKIAILPIDICGGITIKNHYKDKAKLIFINREKKDILLEIIKRDVDAEDKANRILSLDYEFRNKEICDDIVFNDGTIEEAVKQLKKML